MPDWDEAMDEAKCELGINNGQYVKNWDELIELAREIYEEQKAEEYDDFSNEAKLRHQEYLKSDKWKKLRINILWRDNYKCKHCGKNAVDVHHLDYAYLYTEKEESFCISLCRECHKKIHKIK